MKTVKCPHCEAMLDIAYTTSGRDLNGPRKYNVCEYCATPLRMEGKGKNRHLVPIVLNDIDDDDVREQVRSAIVHVERNLFKQKLAEPYKFSLNGSQ